MKKNEKRERSKGKIIRPYMIFDSESKVLSYKLVK